MLLEMFKKQSIMFEIIIFKSGDQWPVMFRVTMKSHITIINQHVTYISQHKTTQNGILSSFPLMF